MDLIASFNSQELPSYPCVCHNASIENTEKWDFYFDISFDEINLPLLGSCFTDDCNYNHPINDQLIITEIKERTDSQYYQGYCVLNFDIVAAKYESEAPEWKFYYLINSYFWQNQHHTKWIFITLIAEQ